MRRESYKQGYVDAVKEIDEVLSRSATRNEDIKKGAIAVLNDVVARLHRMSTEDFNEENELKIGGRLKQPTESIDESFERIARIIFEQL